MDLTNASVNSSSAHPPGNHRAFAHVVSPGGGAFAILFGKDEAFVEQWLVRQGLDKLVDVLKGMFSQF